MNLFKSQSLHEQGRRAHAPAYREPAFGPRYGRHAASRQSLAPIARSRHENVVIGAFLAEREILREMARHDHAA